MKLVTLECIFTDCQSTGASPANGNMLEIAWCKANAQSEPAEIKSFVLRQPEGKQIPFIIQNITGIGDRELEDAVAPVDAYASYMQAFQDGTDRAIDFAVIHYGRFEKAFLEDWQKSHANGDPSLPYRILCTYEIAKRIFPNMPTRGINGLAGYFGATIHDTKRSACHVQATWLIWRGLVEQLANLGIETTSQLEEWLATVKAAKRTKIEYPLEKSKRSTLPDRPGVYRMFDRAGNILYVGKATSLKSRVNSYFRGRAGKDARRMEMLTRVHDLKITECDTPLEAAILETDEIKRLNPPFNVVLKTGRRQLIYYDKGLKEWSKTQDAEHTVGPFSGPFHIEPVIRLSTSLEQAEFDPQIFFDFIEPELLKAGFQIFGEECGLHTSYRSPRQLMALALQMYKGTVRARQKEAARLAKQALELGESSLFAATADDGTVQASESFLDLNLEDSDAEESAPAELTPEEVAGKFERMLLRAARAYLQAKAVCAISNASLHFNDGGVAKQLQVCQGLIDPINTPAASDLLVAEAVSGTFSTAEPRTMDLVTFDRLRVLLSELGRVSAAGSPVQIRFSGEQSVPLWILDRSGL